MRVSSYVWRLRPQKERGEKGKERGGKRNKRGRSFRFASEKGKKGVREKRERGREGERESEYMCERAIFACVCTMSILYDKHT